MTRLSQTWIVSLHRNAGRFPREPSSSRGAWIAVRGRPWWRLTLISCDLECPLCDGFELHLSLHTTAGRFPLRPLLSFSSVTEGRRWGGQLALFLKHVDPSVEALAPAAGLSRWGGAAPPHDEGRVRAFLHENGWTPRNPTTWHHVKEAA